MTTNSIPKRHKILAGVLSLGCLAMVAGGRYALEGEEFHDKTKGKEVLLLPPGMTIRQMDLGHHSLAADLLFIRANLYYAEHILTDEQLPWLGDFIDILLTTDPDFKKAYMWSVLVWLHPTRVTQQMPPEHFERAIRILERGMKRFPEDHLFPMRIGYILYYEMGDASRAIPWFEQAARLPGAPDWLRIKLVDLYTKKGRREIASRVMRGLLAETDDPELNQAIRERLAAVLDPEQRDKIERYRNRLIRGWKNDFDYMSLDTYILVREQ